jgi:hypothetical protein
MFGNRRKCDYDCAPSLRTFRSLFGAGLQTPPLPRPKDFRTRHSPLHMSPFAIPTNRKSADPLHQLPDERLPIYYRDRRILVRRVPIPSQIRLRTLRNSSEIREGKSARLTPNREISDTPVELFAQLDLPGFHGQSIARAGVQTDPSGIQLSQIVKERRQIK